MSLENFVADLGTPTIQQNQSIDDILEFGFDPARVEFDWLEISAESDFVQDGAPQPVAAEVKGEVGAKVGQDGKPVVTAKVGVKGQGPGGTTLSADVSGQVSANGGTATGAVTTSVTMQVPNLSPAGIIALLTAVIVLGALRRKRRVFGGL
jgi:hypothetical protein